MGSGVKDRREVDITGREKREYFSTWKELNHGVNCGICGFRSPHLPDKGAWKSYQHINRPY